MPEDSQSFAGARVRLEEIVSQVRKKDTSLEKSLDLLEEGVRLANQCTELIDHADWEFAESVDGEEAESDDSAASSGLAPSAGDTGDVLSDEASIESAGDQTTSDVAEAADDDLQTQTDDSAEDENNNEDA